jgi:membrane protein implicated in regulation of membrane protease activity
MLTGFIVAGAVMCVLEVVLPGMVLGFLGASALLVAGSIWLGWTSTWTSALTTWFILSLVLLVGLRGLFQRLVGGESVTETTDEESDAYGQVVDVVEVITPEKPGRISYRGSTWEASCLDYTINAGSKAMLAYRDNLVWVVERAETPILEKLSEGGDSSC